MRHPFGPTTLTALTLGCVTALPVWATEPSMSIQHEHHSHVTVISTEKGMNDEITTSFWALGTLPVQAMTSAEMANVEGKSNVAIKGQAIVIKTSEFTRPLAPNSRPWEIVVVGSKLKGE